MTIKKLADHKYAQCTVYSYDDGEVVFYSYKTPVIYMTNPNGVRHMECTGTYSPTTRKQIGWFLKEYAPDLSYYDMKSIVGAGSLTM